MLRAYIIGLIPHRFFTYICTWLMDIFPVKNVIEKNVLKTFPDQDLAKKNGRKNLANSVSLI